MPQTMIQPLRLLLKLFWKQRLMTITSVECSHFAQAIVPMSNSHLSSGDFEEEEEDSDMLNALGKTLGLITQGVNRFIHLTDDSEEVPKLKKRQYLDFKLTQSDWKQLSLLHEALQEPTNVTQSFLSLKDPTVWQAILVLEFLHFLMLSLLQLLTQWKSNAFDKGVRKLKATFDQYHTPVVATPQPILVSLALSRSSMVQYGHSWMRLAILSRQSSEQTIDNPHQELDMYLTSPLEEHHSAMYPTLACMA
ncbi:hypothetical protein BDR04DRAFT_1120349 [Suillus decipiens]|nr:hypothetical protein BDR04DRAFT_1120349 [Suillus decipiens]